MARKKSILGCVDMSPAPFKFTIDGVPFEFPLLSLGTLLLVEQMAEHLNLDMKIMETNPVLAWLLASHQQTDDVRMMVALLTIQGDPQKSIKKRIVFLREHCSIEDLCVLLLGGMLANKRWLGNKRLNPQVAENLTNEDLWEKPFVELLKEE